MGSSRAKASSLRCLQNTLAHQRARESGSKGDLAAEHSEHSCPSHLLDGTTSRACHTAVFAVNVSLSVSYRGQLSLSPFRHWRGHRS